MCRVIADLLNPKGCHYKGDLYLNLFWDIISPKIGDITLNTANAKVITEHSIDAQRRIDIVITDGNIFIPIEAKIWAGEQKDQVKDYAEYSRIRNKGKNIPVLFLTLNGKASETAAQENEYIRVSFKDDIVSWLKQCLMEKETKKTPPVHEVIKQLLMAIKSVGEMEDREMNNEIANLITQSDETIRSALAINAAIGNLFNESIEYFQGEILTFVREKLLGVEYSDAESWISIYAPIKKGRYGLYIHYDWRWIRIGEEIDKEANSDEQEKIARKMTDLFGVNNDNQDGDVWATKNAHLPGLETVDEMYLYKLRKKYADDPQKIAEQIIAIVNELEKI
jgi:hypothetical protein